MTSIDALYDKVFENNRRWAEQRKMDDPGFFERLATAQHPDFLFIGCSDSRVPFEEITGVGPGEAFVHRNIANLVVNTDSNVQGVIQYAVSVLGVKHIVVCGHYGCGGVHAAMQPQDLGGLNGWLREIRDIYRIHAAELEAIADEHARYRRLVELNVHEQCTNVVKTAWVMRAFQATQAPVVHGWVYGLEDGLLKDLQFPFAETLAEVRKVYAVT